MENQYRVGLLRMERAIRERMGSVELKLLCQLTLSMQNQLLQPFVSFLVLHSYRNLWTRQIRYQKLL